MSNTEYPGRPAPAEGRAATVAAGGRPKASPMRRVFVLLLTLALVAAACGVALILNVRGRRFVNA